ncbi:MAG: DUF2818 family protein [Neisseriaceae bacterium]|nr:DUF2818 family protein [Neisseriaceae bacterium]
MNSAMYILLLVAIVAANLPFLGKKLLWIFPLRKKNFSHRLFEWWVYFILVGIFAYILESTTSPAHKQDWTFWVVTICLFAVFAFPGFIWRYFWKRKESVVDL